MLAFKVCGPSGVPAGTVNRTLNVALPVYDSVFILKFSSNFTFGFGPETPAILNGPSPTEIRVGIGPPGPCEMEYIYHPLSMFAVIRAVPVPPDATLAGETDIDAETGFCPRAAHANAAAPIETKINFLRIYLKMFG